MKTIRRSIGAALLLLGLISSNAFGQPPIPELMEILTGYEFQDTNLLSIWGDPPLSQTNLAVVPTWDYYGLQVDATNAAWLSYPFESEGYPNLYLTNGTLAIWVQPNWISSGLGGTGSGVWSRIIDVGAWTSNASYGWWSIFTDPTGDNIFFSAQTNNGTQTNYLTAPIAWDGTTWHQIVLTYSTSSTCLYLDGALATNGPGISILPPPEALSNGFYVFSDQTGVQQFHGQADQFWIYGNQETDTNEIANNYAYYNAFANPPLHIGSLGDDDPPSPPGGGGGGGTNSGGPTADGIYSPPYGSNQFWLRILPVGTNAYNTDSNSLSIILYGTTNGSAYQIWTTTNLAPPVTWTQQQIFPGATNTNFTVFLFPFTNGPSMFFTAVNYGQDTDGDGLPDWWEMKYSTADFPLSPTNADTGNTGIPDGYKQDSAGDGYNNLQKFQMGIPPNVFITPPAPNNFSAVLNTNGQITFSWSPAANLPAYGAGTVTGYTLTIEDPLGDYIFTNIALGATQSNYVFTPDSATEAYLSSGNDFPDVSLQTDYANANSATAASAPFNYNYQVEINIVRGPQGRLNLISPNIPSGVQAIRVYVNESVYGTSYPKESSFMQPSQYLTSNPAYGGGYTYAFDAPVSGFTNGIYVIPYSQIPIYLSSFQYTAGAVANDGSVGPPPSDKVWTEFVGPISNIPFLDGRTNLQQNLAFLLQAANSDYPFGCYGLNSSGYWSFNTPPGSNYVSAGFSVDTAYQYFPSDPGYNVNLDEFQPFEDNYFYRNFVVTATDINSDGSLNTGVYNTDGIAYLGYVATNLPSFMFDTYNFCANGYTNTPPAILTNWQWTYFSEEIGLGNIGVTGPTYYSPQFSLLSNQSNYYGLPFVSAEVADFTNGNLTLHDLTVGSPLSVISNHTYYLFPQTAAPELTTTGYYFARTIPNGYWSIDPQPGDGVFATTNTTPLMIAGVGGTFGISGWAKQAIANGNPAMFAYLEQYFDQALLCDTNGNPTTNSAGILSEYGEFFPLYPGEVALVTKPDITTGQRGTNIVYVIGLQLDANHDGTMDPSFTGPDSTSPARPFQFWLNNNYDRNVLDPFDNAYYDDDVASNDPAATCYGAPNVFTPDFNFLNGATNRTIPCIRDLQDFARLWVSGVTSNLLTNLPAGSTVTLNWGDVGYPNPGNPTIDLFVAVETNGGIGYLTNDTIAFQQCLGLNGPYMGRLGPGQSLQLNASRFTNQWAGNHFIWCGVTNGSGTLYVTIQDANSNILAQSGAVIQIQDIKQMYERWTIGDAPSLGPSNTAYLAKDDFTPDQSVIPFQYSAPTDTNTPYILYVHGWNMPVWAKDRFAETAFKRLYWQGYQGRFGIFRWPTYYDFDGSLASIVFDRRNYDNSEFNAWQSAAALGGLLTNLSSEYSQNVYVLGHSMGNVVAGEALREATNFQLINTYIASQAAIPAHVYDGSITNSIFTSGSPQTPNIYANWLAGTSGAAARRISYYNTNDYALAPGRWEFNQILKPDQGLFAWNYFFEGTPYSGAANYTPGSVDDSPPWNYFIKEDARETPIYFNVVGVLSNRFEVMAYAAQARSPALGRTTNITNMVTFDLTTIWPSDTENPANPYSEHFYHSAEFRGDCWQQWNYWNTLLYSDTEGFNMDFQ